MVRTAFILLISRWWTSEWVSDFSVNGLTDGNNDCTNGWMGVDLMGLREASSAPTNTIQPITPSSSSSPSSWPVFVLFFYRKPHLQSYKCVFNQPFLVFLFLFLHSMVSKWRRHAHKPVSVARFRMLMIQTSNCFCTHFCVQYTFLTRPANWGPDDTTTIYCIVSCCFEIKLSLVPWYSRTMLDLIIDLYIDVFLLIICQYSGYYGCDTDIHIRICQMVPVTKWQYKHLSFPW